MAAILNFVINFFPQGSELGSRWYFDQEIQLYQKQPENICYTTKPF